MNRLFPSVCLFSCWLAGLAFADSASWNRYPMNSYWGEPANWTPNTVPNGPQDVAAFVTSAQTNVQIEQTSQIELDSILFPAGANTFGLHLRGGSTLTLSGAGVVNDSGLAQNITYNTGTYTGYLIFQNSASAGALTTYRMTQDSTLSFQDSSSSGSAKIILDGGSMIDGSGAKAFFYDQATAANATVTANDAVNGTSAFGATIAFFSGTSADHATLIANGTTSTHRSGPAISFGPATSAAQATIIINGLPSTKLPDLPDFTGAHCAFAKNSDGGETRIELFGNGYMDVSDAAESVIEIGSIEGDGIVYLGSCALTVGTNNLSTKLSGPIYNRGLNEGRGGSLTKIGTGTLTLSGNSDYAGGTTVSDGFLRADNTQGSATGIGAVQVDAGTLGGAGIISGSVTIGSGNGAGAFIAPGSGNTTLTIQSTVTINSDGTYTWRVRPGAKSDKVVANGVTIESGAQMTGLSRGTQPAGTVFTALSNTSSNPISGTFANLPDGGTIKIGNNTFQANYEGGDGNDLTLTVVQ